MIPEQGPDKEIDFSRFMDKPLNKKTAVDTVTEESSRFRTRPMLLIALAIALAGVLIYMLYNGDSGAEVVAPPGYRIIESPSAPPRLEKIPN